MREGQGEGGRGREIGRERDRGGRVGERERVSEREGRERVWGMCLI